jgi:hypothetical protein
LVLIVVAITDYNGRTAPEQLPNEHIKDPATLRRCPKEPLGLYEHQHPGTAGDAVLRGPKSALLCNWSQRYVRGKGMEFTLSEEILNRGTDLTRLTDALNSLPPVTPQPEGEYACPESEPYDALVALRYGPSSEVQVEIGPASCGGYSARNLQDATEYAVTPGFLRLLNAMLESTT